MSKHPPLIPKKISAMPASHSQFVFDTAASAVAEPCGCQQAFYITRYPPPAPVTGPVACVVSPPAVVVLG
nr:hypothetical protein [uncultured Pseudomonas sp.]